MLMFNFLFHILPLYPRSAPTGRGDFYYLSLPQSLQILDDVGFTVPQSGQVQVLPTFFTVGADVCLLSIEGSEGFFVAICLRL